MIQTSVLILKIVQRSVITKLIQQLKGILKYIQIKSMLTEKKTVEK